MSADSLVPPGGNGPPDAVGPASKTGDSPVRPAHAFIQVNNSTTPEAELLGQIGALPDEARAEFMAYARVKDDRAFELARSEQAIQHEERRAVLRRTESADQNTEKANDRRYWTLLGVCLMAAVGATALYVKGDIDSATSIIKFAAGTVTGYFAGVTQSRRR